MMAPRLQAVLVMVCLVSLGLNLFLGSYIVTGIRSYIEPQTAVRERLLSALDTLEPVERVNVEGAVAGYIQQVTPVMEQLRQERKKFAYMLLGPRIDPTAALAQAQRVRMLSMQMQEQLQRGGIAVAMKLDAKRRDQFFKDSQLLNAVLQ